MINPTQDSQKLHTSRPQRNGGLGRAIFMALCIAASASGGASGQRGLDQPEDATGRTDQALRTAPHAMISTANTLASQAGLEILQAGGSATDAAIAAQLVLGLVEPQSSGLGGGAFFLHWDRNAKALTALDGRETAPAAAKPDRFIRDSKPIAFDDAVHSGLSIGTPGVVRLLDKAHEAHGKLTWAKLFEPAIKLATDGFAVSKRLHYLLRWNGPEIFDPTARAYFFDETGSPRPIGYILKNPAYAATLRAIASGGTGQFYTGAIADSIAAAARNAPRYAGDLSLDDLKSYDVVERSALCVPYRTVRVCGMGPPSSGGVAIAQILQLVEPFGLGAGPASAMTAAAVHLICEAEKLAYADRERYMADPAFVNVPAGLTDKAYLAKRRLMMSDRSSMARPQAGEPPGSDKRAFGDDATHERAGTSHISVIDADGNAVAMTTTIEGAFGSGVMSAGFLLNNELTDFSFTPADKVGTATANRVQGGKRPRSSMAPTIVFDRNGGVFAVLGSPGGSRIILYVTKTLIGLIDWQLNAQAAAALSNFGSMGGPVELEVDASSIFEALKLKGYGHAISFDLMNSGTNVIVRRAEGLEGGSDPRREGTALGY